MKLLICMIIIKKIIIIYLYEQENFLHHSYCSSLNHIQDFIINIRKDKVVLIQTMLRLFPQKTESSY